MVRRHVSVARKPESQLVVASEARSERSCMVRRPEGFL
jgi:hypothetical protein